ncbi:hypothetical protein CLV63_101374 [Murinocardiopsis flavida]|uniref:Uncharacterized protein n=1 Tax=Murinocardiopsis flavida TaxID=645275 RepID=A0A2P8DUL7_9ACTN|nr:hypothetical protein [Murinocardiopsis flavida]PSL00895.1 hypothetical protein CLV63_101374 [Murinocardiopsis flavida]
MQRPRSPNDRAASAIEYGAVVILVAALLGGLVFALNSGGGMLAGVDRAVCTLTGGECEPPESQAGAPEDPADPGDEEGRDEQPRPDDSPGPTPSDPGDPPDRDDREPSPSPGPPPSAPPEPEDPDQEVREETEAILEETEIGREYLEYLEDSDLDVTWEDGEGGYWNGEKIQIDGSWDPEFRASTVIHELTHDQMGHIDPEDFDSREEYREAMADFEVQAQLNELEMFEQLEEARGDDWVKPPRQAQYERVFMAQAEKASKAAYEEEYNRALEEQVESGNYGENREGAVAAAERTAERAADRAFEDARYDAMMDHFLDGDAVGSNSGEAYIDVWDRRYDEAHGEGDSGGGCGGFLWHECW